MEPVHIISGRGVPLDRSDVDTDQIIPSDWLKRVERTGFGAGLFSEWRDNRDFVMNQPEFAGAPILITGPNFGIGSSREHAVWALVDYGIRVVISARIADIFKNNSTRSGLVPAEVTAEFARRLIDAVKADPRLEITVDVDRRSIEVPSLGLLAPFTLDESARERLLGGLDDIGVTLAYSDEIDRFETARPDFMPSLR
jgi:3-isopropylmalate/(R)-2-methylmalate dehydratase small subunit